MDMETSVIELDGRGGVEAPVVEAGVQEELFSQALILEVAANCSSFIKHRFEGANGETVLRKSESESERKQVVDAFMALWRKNLAGGEGGGVEASTNASPISLVDEEVEEPQTVYQTSRFFQDVIPSANDSLATWVEQGLRSHHQSFLAVESLGKPSPTMARPGRRRPAIKKEKQEDREGKEKVKMSPSPLILVTQWPWTSRKMMMWKRLPRLTMLLKSV